MKKLIIPSVVIMLSASANGNLSNTNRLDRFYSFTSCNVKFETMVPFSNDKYVKYCSTSDFQDTVMYAEYNVQLDRLLEANLNFYFLRKIVAEHQGPDALPTIERVENRARQIVESLKMPGETLTFNSSKLGKLDSRLPGKVASVTYKISVFDNRKVHDYGHAYVNMGIDQITGEPTNYYHSNPIFTDKPILITEAVAKTKAQSHKFKNKFANESTSRGKVISIGLYWAVDERIELPHSRATYLGPTFIPIWVAKFEQKNAEAWFDANTGEVVTSFDNLLR